MSTQVPTLPEKNAAYKHVFDTVHVPAFFHKLAQLGHAPQSQQDAAALLELGLTLYNADPSPAVKQAAAPGPYSGALSALKEVLGTEKTAAANESQAIALQLAQDPSTFASALSLLRA